MTGLKLIMAVSILPTALILYIVMRNETKPKKNMVLGVTLPHDQRESSAVTDLCRRYRRALAIVTAVLAVLAVPGFFFRHSSVITTYLLTWLTAVILLIPAVFVRYRQRLLRYKRRHLGEWAGRPVSGTANPKTAELAVRRVHGAWFIPPAVISLIPVWPALQRGGAGMALMAGGTGVLMVALFYWIYRLIFRQRVEAIDEDMNLAAALTRVRRKSYGMLCVGAAWLTGLFNLVFWMRPDGLRAILATAVYVLLLITLSLYAEMKTRKSQHHLTEGSGKAVYIDEDERWIGGLIYYNPGDRKLLVSDRTGMGMSLNMARPAGRVMMVLSALVIITMPLWGVWMMAEEFMPPTLRMEAGVLIVAHTREFVRLPVSGIESAERLEILPRMTRTSGTGMDTVRKGRFRAREIGSCRICLDPTQPPFLLIRSGGETYIFSDRSPAVTEAVYEELVSAGAAG